MIDPEGHNAAQAPHPAQMAGSISTKSPAEVMAPVGQISKQFEQADFCAREWAHRLGSVFTNNVFSNVPTMCDAFSIALATEGAWDASTHRYPSRFSCAGNSGVPPRKSKMMSQCDCPPWRDTLHSCVPCPVGSNCCNASIVTSKFPSVPVARRKLPVIMS